MSWRERHRRKVAELEEAATEVVLGQLDRVVRRVTRGFAATTSAAGSEPADAAGSLDDVRAAQPMWVASVDGTIIPWFGEVFEAGGAAAVAQIAAVLDRSVPDANPDLVREAASWFLAQTRPRFVQLGEDMAARAQAEMLESFQAGESIAETRRRLRNVTDLSRADAEMVARTQVIAASNAGAAARTSLIPAEVRPRYKVWLATNDTRTRPTHREADGQAVELDQAFQVGGAGLQYPGDPAGPADESINCRCTQIYSDEPALPDVDRQRGQGGIVDRTDIPPASAAGVPFADGGALVPAETDVILPAGSTVLAQADLIAWRDRFQELTGSQTFQLDVDMAVAEMACATVPNDVQVLVGGQPVVKIHWRDPGGDLVAEVVATADLASTELTSWSPPPDARCVEEGCHQPATTRRPLTASIDELVCAQHAGRDLAAANVDSTTGEVHTGAMIALLPSAEDAERLALEGGESTEQLHVTLWFLGEADAIPDGMRAALRSEVETRAETHRPIEAQVFGASVWNPGGDGGGSLNWNVGGPDELVEVRDDMRSAVINAPDWAGDDYEAAKAWSMPENHTPWAAHMCARYGPADELSAALPAALERVGPVTLDRVRLAFGGEVIDIPLGTSQDAPDQVEEDTMAASATDPDAVEVVKTPDGMLLRMSSEPISAARTPKPPPGKRVKKAPNGQCPPGYRPDGDGCVSTTTPPADDAAAEAPAAAAETEETAPETAAVTPQPLPGEHFRAVMHIQNVSTGMRTFKNLTWREPPFAYHRQVNSSAHGGTPEVVQVGLVNRVVADGDTLYGFGPIDLDSEQGFEHARRLVAGFERWVSIGLDEQPSNVEIVWPEVDEDDVDDDGKPMLLPEPEQIIFDGGRIGELTAVSVPAQDQATVEPTAELIRLMEERGQPGPDADEVVVAAVVGSTDLPVADRDAAWDTAAATNRVFEWASSGDRVDVARVSRAFLYRDPDADPQTKTAWKLGFADVIDGQLRIVPRGVATTAGGRGVNRADIPEADKARIRTKICTLYGKVRSVHDDWPDCPFGDGAATTAPEVEEAYEVADVVQGLAAAAYRIEIPELPPRWWYDEPTDVELTSALNITPEGRVYGVLAPLGTGHRAFANSGRRLTAPFGQVDYDRFMGAWALTSKGRIAAGPITMECGHADRFRTSHDVAPAHYENSCTVFATVRVGESRRGGYVWVAGALQPGVTPDLVSRALACRLSGDWQPHPDKAGWQELIAALLVPSPGFPMAHRGPSLSVGDEIEMDGALVASSVHAEVPVRAVEGARPTLRVDPVNRRVARLEA